MMKSMNASLGQDSAAASEQGARRWRGLYPITPEEADDGRLLALASAVLEGGPALLQYRSKSADGARRRRQASALLRLCRAAGVPLIINDDVELALAVGADGVHLGRDDGDVVDARQRLGTGAIIGITCYADLERARAGAAAGADYVAFGAVFPSSTKRAAPPAPLTLLTAARAELEVPVVAIGGIRLENAPVVLAAGADLLAVVHDVFAAPDPAARAAAYRELFQLDQA